MWRTTTISSKFIHTYATVTMTFGVTASRQCFPFSLFISLFVCCCCRCLCVEFVLFCCYLSVVVIDLFLMGVVVCLFVFLFSFCPSFGQMLSACSNFLTHHGHTKGNSAKGCSLFHAQNRFYVLTFQELNNRNTPLFH